MGDVGLVGLALFELVSQLLAIGAGSQLGVMRLARLTRVSRVLRLLRLEFFAELTMMIEGSLGGMKTFIWSCLLLLMPVFFLAFTFRQSIGVKYHENPDETNGSNEFRTLAVSFFTCFRCLIIGDCATSDENVFALVTEAYGAHYGLLWASTSLFMLVSLFNVIVAIFVENTMAAAKSNDMLQKRLRDQDQHRWNENSERLMKHIVAIKSREEGTKLEPLTDVANASSLILSKPFFKILIADDFFRELMREFNIANEDIPELFDTFDADLSGFLSVKELLRGLKKMRGEPRRSDVVGISLTVHAIHDLITSQDRILEEQGQTIRELVDALGLVS